MDLIAAPLHASNDVREGLPQWQLVTELCIVFEVTMEWAIN
jgi:hypothetical protein